MGRGVAGRVGVGGTGWRRWGGAIQAGWHWGEQAGGGGEGRSRRGREQEI